ncbi:MAG TPA: hypothetical protein VEI95_12320 [Acidobacteriota bacterium]|nr:hypothetical protein [Acidobacteriota bacterium]
MTGRNFCVALLTAWFLIPNGSAVNAAEITACGIVTAADAEKFVGGPLDVNEQAKVPTTNGPGTYNSICTYIAKGGDVANAFAAPRLLDVTLRFLHSSEAMALIYDNSMAQYLEAIQGPNAQFKNASIAPIQGFGDKAFILESVTDQKTGYKGVLLVFYKGNIGGSVAAWKKPDPSIETTKAVAKFILDKLP